MDRADARARDVGSWTAPDGRRPVAFPRRPRATHRHPGAPCPTSPPVIPKPARLEATGDDPFVFSEATTVVVNGRPDLIGIAVLAADLLGRVTGPLDRDPLRRDRRARRGAAAADRPRTATATSRTGWSSSAGRVELEARSPAGLVRAIVTLRQLLTTAPDGSLRVPAVRHRGRAAVRVARPVDRRRPALRRQA